MTLTLLSVATVTHAHLCSVHRKTRSPARTQKTKRRTTKRRTMRRRTMRRKRLNQSEMSSRVVLFNDRNVT